MENNVMMKNVNNQSQEIINSKKCKQAINNANKIIKNLTDINYLISKYS